MNFKMSRKHHVTINNLRQSNKLLTVYSIVITIAFISAAYLYMSKSNDDSEKFQNYEATIAQMTEQADEYKETMAELSDTVTGLVKVSAELYSDRENLVACNNEINRELNEFREKQELYDKYEFALYYNGERTDITYDQLRYLEEIIEDSSFPEPEFLLAWIMTESHGNTYATNPNSTAKGYGQFLNGTSKSVWTNILGYDSKDWSPEIAYDGYTNLELMVAYTDYLYDNKKSFMSMMYSYTGYTSESELRSYLSKLNEYLKTVDKSVLDYERTY